MKQTSKKMGPRNLRVILIFLQIVILISGGYAFYWSLGLLRGYSTELNQRLVDAEASGKQIEKLQGLKNYLSQSVSLVQKANLLFAAPSTYQSQVINDIKNHANISGLKIATTNFPSTSQTTATSNYSIDITFKEPVSYAKLINFLNRIESNLPKLQVSSIALSKGNGDADSVTVGTMRITIAVR